MPRSNIHGRNRRSAPATPAVDDGRSEKLHKMLAAAGVGSRRDMEVLIAAGRVTINGRPAGVADRVSPADVVKLDGHIVPLAWDRALPKVMLYHKPEGEIVSKDDPEGRPSVFHRLPRLRGQRWISIGRLDINTEGLLIFTTSGELANRLAHPRYEVEREYAARVLGEVTQEQLDTLTSGVDLEDGQAWLERIVQTGGEGANQWFNLVIKEGRNREVRRLFEAVGLTVSRLIRVRFGPVAMPPRLKRGMLMELPDLEVKDLLEWCGLADEFTKRISRPKSPEEAARRGHPFRRRLMDPDKRAEAGKRTGFAPRDAGDKPAGPPRRAPRPKR